MTLADEKLSSASKFDDNYILDKRLRSGSYGVVYTTRHKVTNEEYAVKVIDRTKLKKRDDDAMFREVEILRDLQAIPNIVGLIDFYLESQTFYVVQVYAQGGDVFDRLAKRVSYTEKDARDLGIVLLKTMKDMHRRKICHRDLKPENLLLKDQGDDAGILLADFGFAKYVPEGGLKTRCGTPAFVAPEILVGEPYDTQADMWSVGCLLYMLIGGYPPFQDETHRGLFRKIRAADFTFHDVYWANVSVHAKQLIAKLLTVDPKLRLNADNSLLTAWLQVQEEQLSVRDLSGSIDEIKKFSAKRKLKSAMHAVMWGVHSAFRTDKVSDLMQMADKKDEENKSLSLVDIKLEQHAARFNLGRAHKHGFDELYELGPKIHRGSFAVVKECRHREWDEKYAVKIIKRDKRTDEAVLHEVAIMNQLDHPHIVKVVDFFEEEEFYYIVMELMAGGDVFDRIISMNQYTEADARDLAKILLEAVNYMHQAGIAHRDLKPQNLLLRSKNDNATIKVADFGFSRKVHTPKSLSNRCGTPSYVAPEILKNIPYDQSCDMWSVGVILYVLLCGYTPFMSEDQEQMFDRIKCGQWDFDPQDWKHVSEEAKDLIRALLDLNPDSRMTAARALRSKWILKDTTDLSSRDLSQSVLNLKERRPRLRDVARAFLAIGNATKNALGNINPIQGETDHSHQLL